MELTRAEVFESVRDLAREHRELVRLAARCVQPFVDGAERTYTQAEALRDLEEWFEARPGEIGRATGGI